MTVKRDPDAILAAWLHEGPAGLPDATRRAIAVTTRTPLNGDSRTGCPRETFNGTDRSPSPRRGRPRCRRARTSTCAAESAAPSWPVPQRRPAFASPTPAGPSVATTVPTRGADYLHSAAVGAGFYAPLSRASSDGVALDCVPGFAVAAVSSNRPGDDLEIGIPRLEISAQ